MTPALPRREWDPGAADDLVGPHEALPVSGEETLRAFRVEPRQVVAKPDAAQVPMELESFLPDSFGDFRNRRQTSLNCPDVKAGAADQNRQPPRSRRHRDLVDCQRAPTCDRAGFGGIEKAV